MRTLEWLTNPTLREILLPGMLAGLAVITAGSQLSVLVVLKRLAFVGQGVSHSAFGGIGVAAVAGLLGAQASTGSGWAWSLVIILAFCIAAAIGMAVVSDRKSVQEDTAIGVFLVASMSLGAVLLAVSTRSGKLAGGAGYESLLFGQILTVSWRDAWVALTTAIATLVVLMLVRRPLLFWTFDEPVATASGVPGRVLRLSLMVLLAVAIVTAMKLLGVVLATAILMLPGATALKCSRRLGRVLLLSLAAGLISLLGGVMLSLELDLPTGATIVLTMTALFAAVWFWRLVSPGATPRAATAGA